VGDRKFKAAVNIGTNPTFTPDKTTLNVEAYLLDFDEDIYGEVLYLEFVKRLRDELKYTTVEALIEQIEQDVEQTRVLLGTESPFPFSFDTNEANHRNNMKLKYQVAFGSPFLLLYNARGRYNLPEIF
jgi:hypothetical protein